MIRSMSRLYETRHGHFVVQPHRPPAAGVDTRSKTIVRPGEVLK